MCPCRRSIFVCVLLVVCTMQPFAQTLTPDARTSPVPMLVNFNGTANDATGKPLTGQLEVTFNLYKEQEGGSPLWTEIQQVQVDSNGHYAVLLGSTSNEGLPARFFASGEARWLGVQVQDQEEQARVLLVSVPYALKAADAETLGGIPASAFVRMPSIETPGSQVSASGVNAAIPASQTSATTNVTSTTTRPRFQSAASEVQPIS